MSQKRKKIIGISGTSFEPMDIGEVDYELESPNTFFGTHDNLVPLASAVAGPRVFYGARFYNQAVPLVNPERPLVQTSIDNDPEGRSFEEYFGKSAGAVRSKLGGIVKKVDTDSITLTGEDGEDHTIDLYNNFAFNRFTSIHNIPLVKEGDKVEPNQLLARSNYTDDTGTLSLGVNARVGITPYQGYSLDDAIVISEDFAKKLTSEHMFTYTQDFKKGIQKGKGHYASLFPKNFTVDQLDKLDDDGIVTKGTILEKGDPIVLATAPRIISSQSAQLGKLSKYMRNARNDASTVWEYDEPGEVTDVERSRDGVKLNVKAALPAKVGDKITMRPGQKSYHPDTEVCTERGWVRIPELLHTDTVASLFDVGDGKQEFEVRYVKPYYANSYVFDGELYGLNTERAGYLVTSNHRIWRKSDYATSYWYCLDAKKVHGTYQLFAVATEAPENNSKITFQVEEAFTTEDYYKEKYHGHVYCLQVPGEGVILTRFRGKIMWNGNSVISKILPQDHTPRTKDGTPLDVILNNLSLPSRVNAATPYELFLGKVAKARGEPIKLSGFNKPNEKWYEYVRDQLAEAGLSDVEEVYDPLLDKTLENPIAVGDAYILKLHHTSESKISDRSTGAYDLDRQPLRGGDPMARAKRLSGLETTGLLSAGATNILKEMSTVRGTENESYWRAVRQGQYPRNPDKPFIWDKFLALMVGAGFDTKDIGGGRIRLGAFTDKALEEKKPLEVKTGDIVDAKSLTPIPGGLFDPSLTLSNSWGYIPLDFPVPNPAYEEPVRRLLNLTQNKFNSVLKGEEYLDNGETGPIGIQNALKELNLDDIEKESLKIIKSGRKTRRPDAIKKLNYVEGMRRNDITPEDLLITKVPVIPAKFRPFAVVGDTFITGDANELYRDLISIRDAHRKLSESLGEEGVQDNVINVYRAVKASYGFDDPITPKLKQRGVSGFLEKILGRSPKFCYDDETEILTESFGWVYFKDLTKDTRVATINPETLEMEWQHPTAYTHDRYVGDMIQFKDDHTDLLVTPNHRMWVSYGSEGKWGIKTAKELLEENQTFYMVTGREQEVEHNYTHRNKVTKVERKDYNGYVHCVTVDNGLVVVRRNERVAVSGNSVPQRKLFSKPVDFAGRSVITVDPDLGLDEVGIPEDMAWNLYKPYVQRRLVRAGYSPANAVMAVQDRTDSAKRALDTEMQHRPVMYSRAPAWHKFNTLGGYGKLVEGDAIAINPLITTGGNFDFDGDTVNLHVPALHETVDEIKEKLLPSKMLHSIRDPNRVVPVPKHELILSLYTAASSASRDSHIFPDEATALEAIRKGKVKLSDRIQIQP